MAPSRAYIPSRALFRAFFRPLPPPCSLARPLPTQFLRLKRTTASPTGVKVEDDELRVNFPGMPGFSIPVTTEEAEKAMRPLTEEQINDPDMPVIEWYEQDMDRATPERFIQRIATPEDRRKHNELAIMLDEDNENPDYDDAHLNRRLLDDLMTNPNFADLTGELQMMKARILTREEQKKRDEDSLKKQEPQLKEMEAEFHMDTHESLQKLINDPKLADAKADLLDLQERLPEGDEWKHADSQKALLRAEAKLSANPAFMKKLEASRKAKGVGPEEMREAWDMTSDEALASDEYADTEDSFEGTEKLLMQVKDLMGAMGGDKALQNEIDTLLQENPLADTTGDFEREMDFDELSKELAKLAESQAPSKNPPIAVDENSEQIDPELEAKVDLIMQDPNLIEKLAHIQRIVTEAKGSASDITNIRHEVAPDPATLEAAHTVGMQERIAIAKRDPEHLAALAALRVSLPPPFHISPALKSFNQAIELAYMGANDDVRRILWRAYSKARTLPTFLRNLNDDSWDLLYYSQAVTWGSNQNRESHLRVLLEDLRRVGRDGPPTHPSTLVPSQ